MNKLDVRVEYIHHSGFTMETEEYFFIFDYYEGHIDIKDKKIIVLVSHGHEDHYREEIFKWNNDFKDINYVVSSDIEINEKRDNIHIMEPYEEVLIDKVSIKSFGSNDLGLSFLLDINGLKVFHSGDLNWWHWEGDPKSEQLRMEKTYKEELDKIGQGPIDIAFVPVDPRLEGAYYLAGDYFIKTMRPKYFFPMHFGDIFHASTDFIHRMGHTSTRIVDIVRRNQVEIL